MNAMKIFNRHFVLRCAAIMLLIGSASAQDSMDGMMASSAAAEIDEVASRQEFRALDEEVQDLKKEVLDLNRDLFLLEEELLFPANSQVAFFISMDVGEYFAWIL